jgi:hypothetical protein
MLGTVSLVVLTVFAQEQKVFLAGNVNVDEAASLPEVAAQNRTIVEENFKQLNGCHSSIESLPFSS